MPRYSSGAFRFGRWLGPGSAAEICRHAATFRRLNGIARSGTDFLIFTHGCAYAVSRTTFKTMPMVWTAIPLGSYGADLGPDKALPWLFYLYLMASELAREGNIRWVYAETESGWPRLIWHHSGAKSFARRRQTIPDKLRQVSRRKNNARLIWYAFKRRWDPHCRGAFVARWRIPAVKYVYSAQSGGFFRLRSARHWSALLRLRSGRRPRFLSAFNDPAGCRSATPAFLITFANASLFSLQGGALSLSQRHGWRRAVFLSLVLEP